MKYHCYDGNIGNNGEEIEAQRNVDDLGEMRIEPFTYEDLSIKCANEPHTVALGDRVTVYSFNDADVYQTTHDDSRISYAILRK